MTATPDTKSIPCSSARITLRHGLWAGTGGEGAKFWMAVLTDLRSRARYLRLSCISVTYVLR